MCDFCARLSKWEGWFPTTDFDNSPTGKFEWKKVCPDHKILLRNPRPINREDENPDQMKFDLEINDFPTL